MGPDRQLLHSLKCLFRHRFDGHLHVQRGQKLLVAAGEPFLRTLPFQIRPVHFPAPHSVLRNEPDLKLRFLRKDLRLQRIVDPYVRVNVPDFIPFEGRIVHESSCLRLDIQQFQDPSDPFGFIVPGDLRTQEILPQPPFFQDFFGIVKIIFTGHRLDDAPPVQFENSFLHPRL